MHIEIRTESFSPWQEVDNYQRKHLAPGGFGACAVFVGSMRDFNQGEIVTSMTLEHYAGMTEQQLTHIAEESAQKYGLLDVLLLHRIGEMRPNEPIVVVAVWSAHRAEAFTACREIMEMLKSRATFWKKEVLRESERWVKANTNTLG